MSRKVVLWSLPILIGLCQTTNAEVQEFQVKGYTSTQEVILPNVTPLQAFHVMTGDIKPWWDHTFSEHPARLFIEPKFGGGFYEWFDETGNGVRHAVVTGVDRGKLLRFEGPLGLAGRSLTFVVTWTYTAVDSGTKVSCVCNFDGQVDAQVAGIIDGVWRHFLFDQLLPYVESGRYLEKLGG